MSNLPMTMFAAERVAKELEFTPDGDYNTLIVN